MQSRLVIFLLAFVLLVPWLGNRDFYSRGEPREALIMQDILTQGRWILPEGYGGAVPSKPPLMHWLSALASLPSGEINEFTSRLPSALSALFFAVFFASFLRKHRPEGYAFAASAVLLTAFEWFRSAFSARVDMLLAATLTAALFCSFEWLEKGGRSRLAYAVLLYTAATLTKGPVSLVLPAAVLGLFQLLRGRSLSKSAASTASLLFPALVLPLVWYLLAMGVRQQEFIAKVYYENVQRFLGTQEDEPHKASAFVLYLTVLSGLLPWTLFVIPQAAAWLKRKPYNFCKQYLGRLRSDFGFTLKEAGSRMRAMDALDLFMAITAICFVLFYSIPSGKRSVYLLPVYPCFAYWISGMLEFSGPELKKKSFVIGLWSIGLIMGGLSAAFAISLYPDAAASILPNQGRFYLEQMGAFIGSVRLYEMSLLALPFAALCWVYRYRGRLLSAGKVVAPLFALVFSVELALNAAVLKIFSNAVSPRQFAQEVSSAVKDGERLYSFGTEFYGLSFYMAKRIDRFEDKHPSNGWILLEVRNAERLKKLLDSSVRLKTILTSSRGIVKPDAQVALMQMIPPPR